MGGEDLQEYTDNTGEELLRSIQVDSMPMELSILELPLFQFTYYTKAMRDNFIVENPISEEAKIAEESMWEFKTKQEKEEMYELMGYNYVKKLDGSWVKQMYVETSHIVIDDEEGKRKVLTAKGFGRLPRSFEFDVFFGLFRLFVKKYGPFHLYKSTGKYEIKQRKLYFTFYELAKFMGLSPTGKQFKEFRRAIRLLKYTQYTSIGLIMDKSKGDYIFDNERPISLIEDYEFNSKAKTKNSGTANSKMVILSEEEAAINSESDDMDNRNKSQSYNGKQLNMVRFSDLILENVENEYFKYLKPEIYFTLPSGLPRKFYGYLEKNRYDRHKNELPYIIRKYTTLKSKIPIDYDYLSRGKDKIRRNLQYLIDIGFIKGFIFCDETPIDGKYEEKIIICFKFSPEDTIKDIERNIQRKRTESEKKANTSSAENKSNSSEKPYLKLPLKDLKQELLDRGVGANRVDELIKSYSKWDIIKMIILLDKVVFEDKIAVPNPGGFLATAILNHDKYNVHQEILDFINEEMIKESKGYNELIEEINAAYDKYKKDEFDRVCKEEPLLYQIVYDSVLESIRESYEKYKRGEYSVAPQHHELYDEFGEKETESRLFKMELIRGIELKSMMDYSSFYNKYIAKMNKK